MSVLQDIFEDQETFELVFEFGIFGSLVSRKRIFLIISWEATVCRGLLPSSLPCVAFWDHSRPLHKQGAGLDGPFG